MGQRQANCRSGLSLLAAADTRVGDHGLSQRNSERGDPTETRDTTPAVATRSP